MIDPKVLAAMRKPLDEIRPADAQQVIRDVLKRGTVPVEVARFGSAI